LGALVSFDTFGVFVLIFGDFVELLGDFVLSFGDLGTFVTLGDFVLFGDLLDFGDTVILGDFVLLLGDFVLLLGDFVLLLGDFVLLLGDFVLLLGDFVLLLGDFVLILGDFVTFLGDFVCLGDFSEGDLVDFGICVIFNALLFSLFGEDAGALLTFFTFTFMAIRMVDDSTAPSLTLGIANCFFATTALFIENKSAIRMTATADLILRVPGPLLR
jgi:hypothetical protein